MKCYSLTTKAKIIVRFDVENSSKQKADGSFLYEEENIFRDKLMNTAPSTF